MDPQLIMAIIITLAQILKGTQFTAVNIQRFISGIKTLLISGGCCCFNFSTLYAMKHWFEFKHWLFVLVIIFHIFQLEGVWWQDFSPVMWKKARRQGGQATVVFSLHHVPWICRSGMWLNSIFWINNCLIPSLRINITWFSSWKKHKA